MTKIKLIESEVIWILYYTERAYKVKECRIRWLFLSLSRILCTHTSDAEPALYGI